MKKNFLILIFILFLCFFNIDNVMANSCCIYKTDSNDVIYFYTVTHDDTRTQVPVLCFGVNCITNDFTSNNVQLISIQNHPNWRQYAYSVSDCSSMPQNLWYSNNDGKISFYTNDSTTDNRIKATIYTSETCSSDLFFSNNNTNNSGSGAQRGDSNQIEVENPDCEGLIGQDLLDFINKIFRWIQILAPIFVIIMGSVDFAGAILQDDKDALKKATTKFTKRLLIAVALFFIPLILSYILDIFSTIIGVKTSTCGIGG